MGPRVASIAGTRGLAHRLAALAALLALLAPIWLGPMMAPLARALGAAAEHTCACGMAPGTCGCPECAHLEEQRRQDRASTRVLVLKSSCDDGGAVVPAATLPPCVLPAAIAVVASAVNDVRVAPTRRRWISRDGEGPPKPPPRSIAA